MPSFFYEHGGAVITTTFDKYCYVNVRHMPPFQPIARGECTFEELQAIHDKMETELGKEGAFVDAIYYCPHHTDKGFEGERPEYKGDCDCRKPKPGLLLRAAKDWNIDISQSYMVGDSDRDVKAGDKAGCKKSLMIESGECMQDRLVEFLN